jgi:hypothetical protein
MRTMLPALKDRQRTIIAAAAEKLPAEKRQTFVQRVVGRLQLCGGRASDDDLGKMIHQAMNGLIQGSAA